MESRGPLRIQLRPGSVFWDSEVDASDFSGEALDRRVTARALKSGEGLWVIPFTENFLTTDPLCAARSDLLWMRTAA